MGHFFHYSISWAPLPGLVAIAVDSNPAALNPSFMASATFVASAFFLLNIAITAGPAPLMVMPHAPAFKALPLTSHNLESGKL
jgi:hypothetical protein